MLQLPFPLVSVHAPPTRVKPVIPAAKEMLLIRITCCSCLKAASEVVPLMLQLESL